ncbi:MAG TPA: hypothetical protein VEP49_22850, partial [Acidimicrobiia bacterium]|nr:hypothetical protein [Acidimicrobiia bacterium]
MQPQPPSDSLVMGGETEERVTSVQWHRDATGRDHAEQTDHRVDSVLDHQADRCHTARLACAHRVSHAIDGTHECAVLQRAAVVLHCHTIRHPTRDLVQRVSERTWPVLAEDDTMVPRADEPPAHPC